MASRHKEKINSLPHKHISILQQCAAGGDQLEARLGVPLSRELEHVTLLHSLPAEEPWAVRRCVLGWGGQGHSLRVSRALRSVLTWSVLGSVSMTSLTGDSFNT